MIAVPRMPRNCVDLTLTSEERTFNELRQLMYKMMNCTLRKYMYTIDIIIDGEAGR